MTTDTTSQNAALPWQGVYDKLNFQKPEFDDRPLGAHIEEHARDRGDRPALQYFDRTITYSELNEMANGMANALLGLGITRTDVVGIHLPNTPQYIITLVAISKIGCAGSGVSPLLSPPELKHQIEDAGISVLLTMDALAGAFEKISVFPPVLKTLIVSGATDLFAPQELQVPNIEGCACVRFLELLRGASPEFSQQPVDWNDTFMIQYTGGTTGKPKGAELSVRNIMHNPAQYSCWEPWDIGNETAATAFPLFHIAGLHFAMASLRYGACFMLIPNPRDVEFFCGQMIKYPPTRMGAVPTLYGMLLGCPDFKKIDFSGLVNTASGAAPLSKTVYGELAGVIGENKLYDAFGMTESSPVHTCNPSKHYKIGSVGIPVYGAETRIVDLDTGTREMPVGEVGEIISSGPQIMKGYLNLPDETEKAIREWRGKKWMYTGDVGYMDEDGYIFVCDRAKDMLVVGGYKVFSVEVEDRLKELDFIGLSAVIGTPDTKRPGNDIVNLYVELAEGHRDRDQDATREEILSFFRENMAPYKRPKNIYFVDQVPVTSVGKIDKKVLRK